jgi:hypothetical protein
MGVDGNDKDIVDGTYYYLLFLCCCAVALAAVVRDGLKWCFEDLTN